MMPVVPVTAQLALLFEINQTPNDHVRASKIAMTPDPSEIS